MPLWDQKEGRVERPSDHRYRLKIDIRQLPELKTAPVFIGGRWC
ncbi:MAG: hypothetical protein U0401_19470 [Anaerolineae bacterium]